MNWLEPAHPNRLVVDPPQGLVMSVLARRKFEMPEHARSLVNVAEEG